MTSWVKWGGLFGLLLLLSAHDPITTKITWSQEISRIVYKRCAQCHRERGTAFSLITYDEARPWAKAIRDQVLQRRMPPWGAVSGVGEFRDDPSLSQAELDLVVNWVEGGAPKGDEAFLPRAPSFESAPRDRPRSGIQVRSSLVAHVDTTVTAIRPVDLDAGNSMEITAYFPGGEVRHLIWLKDYRKEWTRNYIFREPVRLPKGTAIRVFAKSPARALLRVVDHGAGPPLRNALRGKRIVDDDPGLNFYRIAIEQRRFIAPLAHGVECGVGQLRAWRRNHR